MNKKYFPFMISCFFILFSFTSTVFAAEAKKEKTTPFQIKASTSEENHDATLAVDGDKKTYWIPKDTPSQSRPQSLILKYDNHILVTSVEVTGNSESEAFNVELLGLPGGTIPHGTCKADQPLVLNFDPVKARSLELRFKSGKVQVSDIQVKQLPLPKPTLSNVPYGKHERHTIDFWKAPSDKPTPLVFVIHGGGWGGGDKDRVHRFADVTPLLKAGISLVAINYRLMRHTKGVKPPVKVPLHDAARALQFVRSKAKEWNIDKQLIGAAGGSAGACSSLWLAYHDDLAKPDSDDPIARESTRLYCVAVRGPQTSLDPQQMREWIPNIKYGGHAFGKKNFEEFIAERESILPWIAEYSPYALVSTDDPPVYLSYGKSPAVGKNQSDPTHSANFGVKLKEHCENTGIKCDLVYPDATDIKYKTTTDYLIEKLKSGAEQ
ncbi:discoidin domain-containing protein [Lentisphaera marina]|uniref:discoidin domain-containing protein n=1 Tax=Lentisphaera marina TaxID=1111041 RepID=UPI0023661F79|nr:discoidin domain-containing protein [Lentisphaera marina]MDD7985161.1 discoidin domain-containing protein [Lentisphaera marina]